MAIAARIPLAIAEAEQASETVVVSNEPFREGVEVAMRRDLSAEWFEEIRELHRRVRKRVVVEAIAAIAIVAIVIAVLRCL